MRKLTAADAALIERHFPDPEPGQPSHGDVDHVRALCRQVAHEILVRCPAEHADEVVSSQARVLEQARSAILGLPMPGDEAMPSDESWDESQDRDEGP